MFEIGDLVRFKKTGVANKMRAKPDKRLALIVSIEREVYYSYTGELDDKVSVIWLGTEVEETIPEFYLEKVDKDT